MKKLSQTQINAVIALTGSERYAHFIKRVADEEQVWGLYNDGWALAGLNDTEQTVFPVWPAKDYAELCIMGDWKGYEPRSIDLSLFMQEIIPDLEQKGILPCIFYLSNNQGVTPSIKQLLDDLNTELSRYE